jgi:ATP-dependent DNA helicase RecQ
MDYDKLNKVLAYMQSRQCRQNYMISYFGQSEEDYRCQTCDNCLTNRHGSVQLRQASLEEQQVLKIILRSAERHNGFIGKVKLAAMLHGSSSKQIIDSKLNFSPFYGKLSKLSETDIIELIKSLESFGYLDRGTGKYPTVSLADRGYGAINGGDITMEFKAESKKAPKKEKSGPLFGRKKAPVEDTSEVFSVDDDTSSTSEPTFSEALYNELRELRNDIARETYIQPFQVLNNQSLKELATFKPKDLDSIKTIHGIGQVKADMYGEIFLKTIKNSTNS